MTALANPEASWERVVAARPVTYSEIRERVGPVEAPPQLFPGGHANDNLRLCGSRVLRIYRRDRKEVCKEASLLRRTWRRFRVPHVVLKGADYLVLENVAHGVLEDAPGNGLVIGHALAEIHAQRFAGSGALAAFPGAAALELVRPEPDAIGAVIARVQTSNVEGDLRQEALALLEARSEVLRAGAGPAVLLHGDFTPANLFISGPGDLLVFDWEFARAGPALCDVGQLLRWSPSSGFVQAFARGYVEGGGQLPGGFEELARLFDLPALLELLAEAAPGSRRAQDLAQAVRQTLATLG